MPSPVLILRLGTAFGLHALIALAGGATAPAPRPAFSALVALPDQTRASTPDLRT